MSHYDLIIKGGTVATARTGHRHHHAASGRWLDAMLILEVIAQFFGFFERQTHDPFAQIFGRFGLLDRSEERG